MKTKLLDEDFEEAKKLIDHLDSKHDITCVFWYLDVTAWRLFITIKNHNKQMDAKIKEDIINNISELGINGFSYSDCVPCQENALTQGLKSMFFFPPKKYIHSTFENTTINNMRIDKLILMRM
ncbi:TPA: hypothetical protein ACMEO3_002546 [Klebsiella pneumoniae]|nr:hypothetical protein [Klebsiella pneumoniae]HDU4459167.1 hypothetical protein [Klebsiella pneumoniae subsp. pneumoniae]